MAKGELSLSDPSIKPKILDGWLIERKHREIRKWIQDNFIPSAIFDYDFSDWDNESDLEDEPELNEISTRSIIREHFGNVLKSNELEEILELLDEDFADDWKPSEDRIEVEEVDEDEVLKFLTYSEVRASIPNLLRQVSEVREALFPHLGHNNPPAGLEIAASDLEHLNSLLFSLSDIEDEPSPSEFALLDQLGEAALRIGQEVVRYVAKKGDLFIDKAVEAAGEAAGKWAVRAIAIYYAGATLREFGNALLELLAR